jgi:hypothetical protein
MSALNCSEAPRTCLEPCGCLPPGFARLKYFYGKHLSVADFKDEQRYHVGKQLFHNQRLHGSGVLCGLDVRIDGEAPNEARVVAGSALDQCGREIIVPYDQCIDVAAWYRSQLDHYREEDPDTEWPAGLLNSNGALVACVMLRYAECPTGPEAAPRDPCGCGDNGCEYGRISEGFQLELLPHAEGLALVEDSMFPSEEQITDVLDSTFDGLDLLRRLARPVTERCPGGVEEAWIMLGCIEVTPDPDSPGDITGIIESTSHAPPVLLSTEVIQYLLSKIYADLDTVVGAPSIVDVRWRKIADTSYQIVLVLDKEVEAQSIDPDDSFRLRKMTDTGWDEPAANAVNSQYSATDPIPGPDEVLSPAIYVTIDDSNVNDDFLDAGDKYQLYTGSAPGPVVDAQLRRLRPRDFVWRFRLYQDSAGDLQMQAPPFV